MDSGDASRSPNPNRRDSICLPGVSQRTSNLTKGQTSHDEFLHVAALNETKREKGDEGYKKCDMRDVLLSLFLV